MPGEMKHQTSRSRAGLTLDKIKDEPHAGANNEKLSTRDITKNELPHAGANNEKLYTRGQMNELLHAGANNK